MKAKSYNQVVELLNKSNESELFETYKNDVEKLACFIMKSYFDFDISVMIIFNDIPKNPNFVNREVVGGCTTMVDGKFTVIISSDSLVLAQYDNCFELANTIYHEFGHVYDLYKTMNNKYYTFNPFKRKHKRLSDFLISVGNNLWSEFVAYRISFSFLKERMNTFPTFLELVKAYEALQTDYSEIAIWIRRKRRFKMLAEKCGKFLSNIEDFSYMVVKHAMGQIYGVTKYYDYCDDTKSKQSYKKVRDFSCGLLDKFRKLIPNSYGKNMAQYMGDIGVYVIDNLYAEFKIYPVKRHDNYNFGFFER